MIKNVTELHRKRNSKTALFLGCGPSILSLTEIDKKEIEKKCDLWSSNNFIIHHDIIPHFYHLEVKMHRNGQLMTDMLNLKHEKYQDVNWVLDSTRPYLANFIQPGYFPNIFAYEKTYRTEEDGKYTPLEKQVSVSCNASLTVILDVMERMKYEKIGFLGVDMKTSKYFWTDNPDYKDSPIPDIMKTCKPDERKPDSLHPTFKLKDYIPEFCNFNKINAVNLSSQSLLQETMTTMSIQEFLNE